VALIDATFAAVAFDWAIVEVSDRPAEADDVRARIEALHAAGVHVFVFGDGTLNDVDTTLRSRRNGPGRLQVCRLGSDSARRVAAWLADRGITGSLVLVVGEEFGPLGGVAGRDSSLLVPELTRANVVSVGVEPGGPPPNVHHLGGGVARLLEILDEQLARRSARRVPWIDEDPAWVVPLPAEPTMERAAEAFGTLGNGWAAIRGSREEGGANTAPLFAVNGLYARSSASGLLHGPLWTHLALRSGLQDRRLLDLRTGVLARASEGDAKLRTVRFVSAARPAALGLRAEAEPSYMEAADAFARTVDDIDFEEHGDVRTARSDDPGNGGICVAARDWIREAAGLRVIDRTAAWVAHDSEPPDRDAAANIVAELEGVGFDRLLAEHREAWARRWSDARVVIDGDPESELAARFAVFHLLCAAPDEGEAAVGARGLTGSAYGGHVFWDADVYVLPALSALLPGAARAMLEYRIRRLPAARAAAEAQGRHGARFPWESARDGTDVTPRQARGGRGQLIPIVTGHQEEHIVADVAWAACEYASWTGDASFLDGPGRDLVVDTARYWASRITVDQDGRGHLAGVMGPDEYHEAVDDNAFTNVMARWNLRRGAQLLDGGADTIEATGWRRLADSLVDGWDPDRRLYQQFDGYWDLEPLLAAAVAPPPVAADVLLGVDRVRGSQLIKQADVLMLHHLIPDDVEPASLAADLTFYEPRTAHGSSLSPAIHASLLARAGHAEQALALFRVATRLDLDDVTGTTAGGLHLATMGGVWQALAYGFLGLRPGPGALEVDPCLPPSWTALELRLRFRGHPIGVRADHDTVTISCAEPVVVRVGGGPRSICTPPGRTFIQGSVEK
jgi:trehalose/maltose hydrolase-like predicted phosphorylase